MAFFRDRLYTAPVTPTDAEHIYGNDNRASLTTLDAQCLRYNILGQQVDGSYKGIVIINGKKLLAK